MGKSPSACGATSIPTTGQPSLHLAKSYGGGAVLPGAVLPFTLTVSNSGNQDVGAALLTETVPALSSFDAGQKLTEELVRQKRPFTALMAFDDMSAFGAIRALTKAGIRVPDQCSVIGFDDVAPSALCTPSLTTVRQPMVDMGASAVGIVVDGINAVLEKREVSACHKKVLPELVVRDSTRGLI